MKALVCAIVLLGFCLVYECPVTGQEPMMPEMTGPEAVNRIYQNGGLLTRCRITSHAIIENFVPLRSQPMTLAISECYFEDGLSIRDPLITHVHLWNSEVLWLTVTPGVKLKRFTLDEVSILNGLHFESTIGNDVYVQLGFAREPKQIFVTNRLTADRIHLAAPRIPIAFGGQEKKPMEMD